MIRFLTGSTWAPMPTPLPPGGVLRQPPHLRFVVATTARRPADPSVRDVLLRRIERRDGMTLVEVDGEVFELARCGTRQRPLACLTRTSVDLDDLDDEPEATGGSGSGGFAQPPP